MNKLELKNKRFTRRKLHIRKKIFGTHERPRLTIFRSLNHIYAQIINDFNHETLASASTLDKDVKSQIKPGMKKSDRGKLVGAAIANHAKAKSITTVAFDRNGSFITVE